MIVNEWLTGDADISEPFSIRRAVFVEEQGIPEDVEFDADDARALHLVIRDSDRPVACGRIWHDGCTFRIGRCAVLKDARGQGIGDLLLKLLLRKAFEYTQTQVCLHAQEYAQGFYARYGFTQTGEPFIEGGIPHVEMCVAKDDLRYPSKCGCADGASCPEHTRGQE